MATYLFAGGVLLISAGLAVWQLRTWRRRDNGSLGVQEFEYYRRQFTRRLVMSGLIALCAPILAAIDFVRDGRTLLPLASAVFAIVFAIFVLATLDAILAFRHFERELINRIHARAKLAEELHNLQDQRRREKESPNE